MQIKTDRRAFRDAVGKLRAAGLDPKLYIAWVADAEFDLATDRAGKLSRIAGGNFQYKPPPVEVGDRRFRTIWEFECDRDTLFVLDFIVIELNPKLARNQI